MKWIYDFTEGSREMAELLGGKGAGIAEMTHVLGPERVPPGFTITTEACVQYLRDGRTVPAQLDGQLDDALERLEQLAGRSLGDPRNPLLLSVRSGARVSMPGMLDTVLNLGLNDAAVLGLAERSGDERFAWDCYRRLVQMFGNVVYGVPGERFEEEIARVKRDAGTTRDADLDAPSLRGLTQRFQELCPLPQEPREQLRRAVMAVFDSWTGERSIEYRRINAIPDSWGTAVNVQQMVFGNLGARSCSGVAFSRNEITGAPEPSGDFLPDAQGEDVVSGVRTPHDLDELRRWLPEAHAQLLQIMRALEGHYKDMQDCEFTVEGGRLYMLQTRSAKRPAQAAVRFAVDAVSEGLLSREEAIATLDARALDSLLHPTLDPDADFEVLTRGVAASPGAARGMIVFTAEEAVAAAGKGAAVILVRPFTEAEDVAGFASANGILTSAGGKASHAALVARGMGRPAVTGAGQLEIDLDAGTVSVGEVVLHRGDTITIDGTSGCVTTADVPLVPAKVGSYLATVLDWCDALRDLGVRANADTPADARRARGFGAEGIGLCRTEHMFMAADRQPKMRAMIMASDDAGRAAALAELLPLQQVDFEGLFEAMEGLPVTIRLLDPPLHEFLRDADEIRAELEQVRAEHATRAAELERELERVHALQESNPMLGTRGVRLGILHPDVYEMQVRAIMRAARAVTRRRGEAPALEIMIPLVAYVGELQRTVELVRRVGAEEGLEQPDDFRVGTMIELPRACVVAGQIAAHADFFSFGTNDLTQTSLGFSRDDIEGRIVPAYVRTHILDRSPFESIDRQGVGELVRLAVKLGRQVRGDLELGVCGEHGGDPPSIAFFHESGLDYVSCSPFRVPIARVAAAQAAIASPRRRA